FKDAPRTLDLDLLLYGQLEVATEQLTLPHPRMHQRAFVMVPLKEIAPELMLPKIGNVQQIAESLEIDGIHKI
ncbi:MAG: 2-amino-4-hydroxy-6-hydroxymethyldihydropteridine diphosphokinase, partial [Methylophilaceae bacterium]